MASKLGAMIGVAALGLIAVGGAVSYLAGPAGEPSEAKQAAGSAVKLDAPVRSGSASPAAKESDAPSQKEKAMLAARRAATSAAEASPRSMTDFFKPVATEEAASSLHQSGYSADDVKALDRILAEGRIKVARLTVSASREMALQVKSAGLVQKVHVSGKQQDVVLAYAPGTQIEVYCDDPAEMATGTLNLWIARRMFPLQPIAPGASVRLRTPSA